MKDKRHRHWDVDYDADTVTVRCPTGRSLGPMGWVLACLPTVLSLSALSAAFILHEWLCFAVLTALAAVTIGLLTSVFALQLQLSPTLIVDRKGVIERRYSMSGRQTKRVASEEILSLRAIVQGRNCIRLQAESRGAGPLTLLTAEIENFEEQALHIARVLKKPYCITVNCPLPDDYSSDKPYASPDFVRIDPSRRKLVMEVLDSLSTEVPFDDVVSITVTETHSESLYDYTAAKSTFEYIYRPAINFKDGSFQLLQRFRSFEDQRTNKSCALISATLFANYLRSCMKIGSPLELHNKRSLSPSVYQSTEAA